MKEGDKLYRVVYWEEHPLTHKEPKRELQCNKIISVNKSSYTIEKATRYLPAYYIQKSDVGIEWFPSKIEALKSALEYNKKGMDRAKENLEMLSKEVSYLKKRVVKLQDNGKDR